MKMRVLSIFGTRPEAVKMAPVIDALAHTPGIEAKVCVTAQHRQMLDQVLNLFDIVPDVDLNLMRPNQSLSDLTAAIFAALDPVVKAIQPDWILAQGDTTTVMATALIAYYNRVRFGHVEAGLRTGDKWQPFPEEVNRKVAGVVADLHFAPTEWSRQNLLREGVADAQIAVTGNPVIDALRMVAQQPVPAEVHQLFHQINFQPFAAPRTGSSTLRLRTLFAAQGRPFDLQRPDLRPSTCNLILVTAHRRENFGQPIQDICAALRQLAESYGDNIRIVYPVHLNPNIQEPVYRLLGGIPNIALIPPLDYLPMVHVMKHARLVLTDSGGLQEEAPGLGAPVLVMRETTERPEGVQAGTVKLVGTDTTRIVAEARRLLDDPEAHAAMARAVNPYGDGTAAPRIVQAVLNAGA